MIRTRLATETESRMGLLKWWKSRGAGGDDSRLGEWRRAWQEACASPVAAHVAALSARLNELGLPDDDVEMEREMLEGLEQLARLQALVAVNGLPSLETGHRVVGSDTCHFSAPSSMPEESAQPSGRLILTSARAVFVGGAKATTVPWHAVSDVLQQQRDVVLVRNDRELLYRFRCNLFADAMGAAFLARTLAHGARRGAPAAPARS
jgi:hypothetical protein